MPRRLAQKLIIALTILVAIVSAISGFISTRTQERRILDAMILGADQLSKGITSATWQAMLADNRQSAYEVMKTIADKQGIDRIRMFNRDGRVMFSTGPHEMTDGPETCARCHTSLQPHVSIASSTRVQIFRSEDGERNLTMVTPVYNEPSCSQAACHAHPASQKVLGILDVTLSLVTVDQQVRQMRWQTVLVTVVEILLLGIFIYYFTRHFVANPIQEFIEGTKAVSAMNLDKPIQIRFRSEELDELTVSFNSMRERLREASEENARFTSQLETKVAERTEQLKAIHQKLLQSDRLASLGQLAASVAHEINNPVGGVLNLAMLMQRILGEKGVPEGRVDEFRKYLVQVERETTRVGRIVSDLLSFSRRSKPQRTQTDLNRIVKTTVSLVQHKLTLANVAVELNLSDDLPTVDCDTSQIQQVVLNLVLNGADAAQGRSNSRVIIATRTAPSGDAILLSVCDNGDGIKPENKNKIFDPFFTTKTGKGVGLGLSVTYGIVEAHGGEIEVQSSPGQGATFLVKLPLVAAQVEVVQAG